MKGGIMIVRSTIDPKRVMNEILAGYTFTLTNDENNKFVTYKTVRKKGKLLVWSRITKRYKKLFLISNNNLIPIQPAGNSTKAWGKEMFIIFWNHLMSGQGSVKITIWHPCKCIRCNRLLTDPASIKAGIGPGCAKKL
jgi:hypothetical protein